MSYKFKSGDVVQLKSGGSKMVVALMREEDDDDGGGGGVKVHCSWFDKDVYADKEFDEDLLSLYQPPPVVTE